MAVSLLINSLKEAVAVGKAARTMVSKKHKADLLKQKNLPVSRSVIRLKGNSEQQKEKAQKPTAVNVPSGFSQNDIQLMAMLCMVKHGVNHIMAK